MLVTIQQEYLMRLLHLSYALRVLECCEALTPDRIRFKDSLKVIHLKNLFLYLSTFALKVLCCSQCKINILYCSIGNYALHYSYELDLV